MSTANSITDFIHSNFIGLTQISLTQSHASCQDFIDCRAVIQSIIYLQSCQDYIYVFEKFSLNVYFLEILDN